MHGGNCIFAFRTANLGGTMVDVTEHNGFHPEYFKKKMHLEVATAIESEIGLMLHMYIDLLKNNSS